ncbi:MAG: phosphohydrolase [Prevotellaceae bacterium]|jgi:uncharacterized protein|nr:phosphohydrolase [Prevotellaceae bacterium]
MNPYSIIEKYYTKGDPLYNILVTHGEQVKYKALDVLEKHPGLSVDENFVAEAALLHDIGIFLCNAPGICCFGKYDYIAHGYLGAEILLKEGMPKHALVCERHTGTGICRESIVRQNLPLPKRNMLPISYEEKIVCYADKFFSKTNISKQKSPDEIKIQLLKFGQIAVDRFDELHQLFG